MPNDPDAPQTTRGPFERWWRHKAEPWQFWLPQSGLPGGLIGGAVAIAVLIAAFG